MASGNEKICFVIAPIGDSDSEIRERSDVIFKYIIEPAAESCGYKAVRADKLSESGLITTQVIQHLVNDPMVIADLTGRNPNVYYELAVRHALRKPFIQLIQKGEQIPFDVAGMRTIPVDHRDVAVASEAKGEIIRYMESMQGETITVDSPISVAVDMDILRRSPNPEDRQLGEMFAAVTEIRSAITGLDAKIGDLINILPSGSLRDMRFTDLSSFRRPLRNATTLSDIQNNRSSDLLLKLQYIMSGAKNNNLSQKEQMDLSMIIDRIYENLNRRIPIDEEGESDRGTTPRGPRDRA